MALPGMGNEKDIELYLNRNIEDVREWEAGLFDSMSHPFEHSIVLYGAGNIGRTVCRRLRLHDVNPLAFSDQNKSLWGKTIEGVPVLAPEEAIAQYGSSAAFVVTVWNYRNDPFLTLQNLKERGCERVVPLAALFYKYPEEFLPYYSMDLPHRILLRSDRIRKAYDLMADDQSRQEYLRELSWRMELNLSGSPDMSEKDEHFPEGIFTLSDREVLFDCGAYDGDTLRAFLNITSGRFLRIISFEPDPLNYKKLTEFVKSLPAEIRTKISIRKTGVGAKTEILRFNADGGRSSGLDPEGSIEISVETLDDFLGKFEPTCIKMDIEGAELDALRGGERLIRKCLPSLALCVYHRPDHLWEIPLTAHEISTEYTFYLRRHAVLPWDLVCYGIR